MKYIVDDSSLTGIANAIRLAKGVGSSYTITDMISAIGTLSQTSIYPSTYYIESDGLYLPSTANCDAFGEIDVTAGANMSRSIYSDIRSRVGYVVKYSPYDSLDFLLEEQWAMGYHDFHEYVGYLESSTPTVVDTTYRSQIEVPPVNYYLSTLHVSENGTYTIDEYGDFNPPIYGFNEVVVDITTAVAGSGYYTYRGEPCVLGFGTIISLAQTAADAARNPISFNDMTIPDDWFSYNVFSMATEFHSVNIGDSAFCCADMSNVFMYGTNVGSYAFDDASMYGYLRTQDSVLDQFAFRSCKYLSDVSIYTTDIHYCAFVECSSLRTVELDNVSMIGSYAFASCYGLRHVFASGLTTVPTHGDSVFESCNNLSAVYVPSSLIYSFREEWSEYRNLFLC